MSKKNQFSLTDKEIELKTLKSELDLFKQNFNTLRTDYDKLLRNFDDEKKTSADLLLKLELSQKETQNLNRINITLENKVSEVEKENDKKDTEYLIISNID